MASASSSASPPHLFVFPRTQKPRTTFSATASGNFPGSFRNMTYAANKLHPVKAKAAPGPSDRNIKPNSVICGDCDGNGAVICSQCKGSGVNSVDFFNGQFKAGESCWLCGGKKDMLCGNCNGAGFIGGFLSTYDQ